MNQPPRPKPAAISGSPRRRKERGNRGTGNRRGRSKPPSQGPAKSSGGGAMMSGWLSVDDGPLVIDLQIEGGALAVHVVDLPPEQAVRDDGAAPGHQARGGVRHSSHVAGRLPRGDPALGRGGPPSPEMWGSPGGVE